MHTEAESAQQAAQQQLARVAAEAASIAPLANKAPVEIVRELAPEAIQMIAAIMRSPGRNAQAQLSAARELLAYGLKKPTTTVAGDNDGDPIRMIVNVAGLVDPNA
jgi:hypothetical protein